VGGRCYILPRVILASGRIFSYEEALSVFPVVRDRTRSAVLELESLAGQPGDEESDEEHESAYREIVERWASEIESLGCQVKGLWLVDWDSGDGYFCWKYPEPALGHYHGYEEGFAGRVPIT
jgi:hypothetical protein